MDDLVHINRDPKVCGGEPVIKGTRVTLRTVLASLAEGATFDEILADFPTLTAEDVRAVVGRSRRRQEQHRDRQEDALHGWLLDVYVGISSNRKDLVSHGYCTDHASPDREPGQSMPGRETTAA